jgi:hypothetical protein
MPQQYSGWLTILSGDRWFFHAPRHAALLRSRKRIYASLGPFANKKRLYLGLPRMQPGHFRTRINWTRENDTLRIGPIIGILTVGDGASFLGNKENFRDISLSGKKTGALVYVFTPDGINWEQKSVHGFLYDEQQDLWLEAPLPFPHVVYNRVPSRKAEKRDDVMKTLDLIAELPNVTLFNRCFFDKQTLFQELGKQADVAGFLPETKALDSFVRFKAFCSRHRFVYLKPVLGRAGRGIMRLERKENLWHLQRLKDQQAVSHQFTSLKSVWNYVKERIGNRNYILQQGIHLAKYRGRPFDVRVLVQKNGKGEWGVTGIGIRRAGSQSITTHVPRGGSIQSTGMVLTTLFKEEASKIGERIKRSALAIARALNEQHESLAEMSMDLGLTRDGQLWFFEANAKPEKFDEPDIRQSSLSTLIHYAQYVFRLKDTG